MSGALVQIAAFGTQDVLLMGNPTVTFFKNVVNRHTNFAIETIQQVLQGASNFGASNATVQITRDGDLLWKTFIRFKLPRLETTYTFSAAVDKPVTIVPARWTDDIGHHLIQNCNVVIGGSQIDKHYGDWLQIWSQLTLDESKRAGYNDMIGNRYELMGNNGRPVIDAAWLTANNAAGNYPFTARFNIPEAMIEVPLQFWFCRDPALTIPLVSLPYHDVRISFDIRALDHVVIPPMVIGEPADVAKVTLGYNAVESLQPIVYANYVFLDNAERKRYAQHPQEYLVEQLQYAENPASQGSVDINLNFNHPTKELVFVAQKQTYVQHRCTDVTSNSYNIANQLSNYQFTGYNAVANKWSLVDGYTHGMPEYGNMSTTYGNPIDRAELVINGVARVKETDSIFFNRTQPYMHHSCIPQAAGINVYSFALKPESIQPSGTINFSRIDNTTLRLRLKTQIPSAYGYYYGTSNSVSINPMAPYIYEVAPKEAEVEIDSSTGAIKTVSSYAAPRVFKAINNDGSDAGNGVTSGYNVKIYGLNFNVLRIVSGMGGLAYAN